MVKTISIDKPNIFEKGLGGYKTFNIGIKDVEKSSVDSSLNDVDSQFEYECYSHTMKNPSVADIVSIFVVNDFILSDDEIKTIIENCSDSTYNEIVDAIISVKYPNSDMDAVNNNYNKVRDGLAGENTTQYSIDYANMQSWRNEAKQIAKNVLSIPETLESAINKKIDEIVAYDSSDAVNGFIYNGEQLWLNNATRISVMNSTTILKNAGYETTTLWLNDINVVLPCDVLINMLTQLERYALECYNVTASHKKDVKSLTSIEDVKAYDYTKDYPEMLSWQI